MVGHWSVLPPDSITSAVHRSVLNPQSEPMPLSQHSGCQLLTNALSLHVRLAILDLRGSTAVKAKTNVLGPASYRIRCKCSISRGRTVHQH